MQNIWLSNSTRLAIDRFWCNAYQLISSKVRPPLVSSVILTTSMFIYNRSTPLSPCPELKSINNRVKSSDLVNLHHLSVCVASWLIVLMACNLLIWLTEQSQVSWEVWSFIDSSYSGYSYLIIRCTITTTLTTLTDNTHSLLVNTFQWPQMPIVHLYSDRVSVVILAVDETVLSVL